VEQRFRRLEAPECLPEVAEGVVYVDRRAEEAQQREGRPLISFKHFLARPQLWVTRGHVNAINTGPISCARDLIFEPAASARPIGVPDELLESDRPHGQPSSGSTCF